MFASILRKVFKSTKPSSWHDRTAVPAQSMFIPRTPNPGRRVHWVQKDTVEAHGETSSLLIKSPPPFGFSTTTGASYLADHSGSMSWPTILDLEAGHVLSPSASLLGLYSNSWDHCESGGSPTTHSDHEEPMVKFKTGDPRTALGLGHPPRGAQTTVPCATMSVQERLQESSKFKQWVLATSALDLSADGSLDLHRSLSVIAEEEEGEDEEL